MAAVIEIPRSPIYREKSGSVDTPEQYTSRTLQWRDVAFEQGMSELRDSVEYECIQEYIDLLEGRHDGDHAISSYRSRFTDNRISFARIQALSYLTQIRPAIDIYTSVEEYRQAAKVMKEVIIHEWRRQRMDVALEEVVDHALFGTGFWKISCSYPGEMDVLACGMDTVIPIQQGKNLQDSTAVLYRAFKPPSYFRNRWPSRSDGIEGEADHNLLGSQSNQYARPFNIQEYTWNSMSPSMRYHKSRRTPGASVQDQSNAFPLIELQEYWIDDWHVNELGVDVIVKDPYRALDAHNYWYRVKPGQRLYPRKRLLVFAGERIMYDGPSPYWSGMFPFAKLRLNPVVWSSGGLSKYRDLKPINKSINNVGRGVENVVEKAVKPQMITKDGAVNPTSWQQFFADRPGGRLKLTPMGNPATDVRFIDPPVLPSYVALHHQYLLAAFRELSGSLDLSSMAKKKQVPGGDTIEQFKDSLSAPLHREMRYIEVFLEDAGQIAMPNISQFYSRTRRMQILGASGLTDHDFDSLPGTMYPWSGQPEEFYKNFGIEVLPGSLHAGSGDRVKQVAIVLRRSGDISRRELFRRLEIGEVDRIEQELIEERKLGLGPAQPKGRQQRMTRGQRNGSPI